MTDGELRKAINNIMFNHMGAEGWNGSTSALVYIAAIDELLHLIKQNFPQGEVTEQLAADSSIPDDAGELRKRILKAGTVRFASGSFKHKQFSNKPVQEIVEIDIESLLHLIHQQRQRWEARALRQEIEGRILEVKRNMPNEDAISKYTRFAMQNRIEELETELSSLAAAEGKEDV